MRTINRAIQLIDFAFNPARDIEVFGMFGPGNLGDEAMLVATLQTLPAKRCIPWQRYPNVPSLDSLVKKIVRKNILVAGGTLIHGGHTGWLDYVEMRAQQGSNISFFGTGIAFSPDQLNERHPPFRRWSSILKMAKNVYLRGPFSVGVANTMGVKADIFGDFSFLLFNDCIPVVDHLRRDQIIGINVGNCKGDQKAFENEIIQVIRILSNSFKLVFHVVINTDMEPTLRVIEQSGISNDQFSLEKHYFHPHKFMNSVKNYSAFVGLKLHAAGIAMIAGVPSIMIAYLPKCRDFSNVISEKANFLVDLPLSSELLLSKIDEVVKYPQRYVFVDEIKSLHLQQKATLIGAFS